MPKPDLDVNSLIARNNDITPVLPLGVVPSNQHPTPKKLCLKDLQTKRVTSTTKHPAPLPVIRIMGTNYANRGMISVLTAPPMSGKTTVIGCILATAFTHFHDPALSLGIESSFAEGRDVVYLDFEQHISSTQDLQDRVLRYAGLPETPGNLHIYNLLELTLDDRRAAIELCFNEHSMHLLVIDGLADILTSVNDEEKSNALIEDLALLASRHNTAVVVVIHENKGGGSVRGHLGSQIERKCAGLISIKKDRERKVHSIESRLIRIGDDFDTVFFQYSDEHNRMVLCDAVTTAELTEAAKKPKMGKDEDPEFLSGLMKLCFADLTSLSKTELRRAIQKQDTSCGSDKTADRRISGAVTLGILTTADGKSYAPTAEPCF